MTEEDLKDLKKRLMLAYDFAYEPTDDFGVFVLHLIRWPQLSGTDTIMVKKQSHVGDFEFFFSDIAALRRGIMENIDNIMHPDHDFVLVAIRKMDEDGKMDDFFMEKTLDIDDLLQFLTPEQIMRAYPI